MIKIVFSLTGIGCVRHIDGFLRYSQNVHALLLSLNSQVPLMQYLTGSSRSWAENLHVINPWISQATRGPSQSSHTCWPGSTGERCTFKIRFGGQQSELLRGGLLPVAWKYKSISVHKTAALYVYTTGVGKIFEHAFEGLSWSPRLHLFD